MVSLLFVEAHPEEQQDGHDLVVCELPAINLLAVVGKKVLLCHVSLVLARFFSLLIASQRTCAQAACFEKSRHWKPSGPG